MLVSHLFVLKSSFRLYPLIRSVILICRLILYKAGVCLFKIKHFLSLSPLSSSVVMSGTNITNLREDGEGTREEQALRGLGGSLDKEIKSLKLRALLKGKRYSGHRRGSSL